MIPHIQHFLWRACLNSLPTRDNLHRRKIGTNMVCNLCGIEGESIEHLFLRCGEVTNVWRQGPLKIDTLFSLASNFKHLCWMIEKLPREKFALFACMANAIWNGRNKCYMEQKKIIVEGGSSHCPKELDGDSGFLGK